jgi:DNA-binding response OmpR family regulator
MSFRKIKILIVEDDTTLGETLKERLEKEGYEILWAVNLFQSKKFLLEFEPDLLLIDLRLPDGSGFSLASEIKKNLKPPLFFFITAQAGAPERLKGFELGAEEFIPKPFHMKELILRLKRVLEKNQSNIHKIINFKGYRIDFIGYSIENPSGEKIELTRRDCLLLNLLIQNKKRTISRDEILEKLWGEDKFPTNRTIDNSIVRLRQSLNDSDGLAIRSVRGVGYQWIGEIE